MAIISFSKNFPWNDPTNFVAKIRGGIKIHTLRGGNAWYPGRVIDFWSPGPRNGGKEFELPTFDLALSWKEIERPGRGTLNRPVCSATESWEMKFENLDSEEDATLDFKIGELEIDENILELVAAADGFDTSRDFVEWFLRDALEKRKGANEVTLTGQLIHWTDKVYDLPNAQTIDHDYFKNPR